MLTISWIFSSLMLVGLGFLFSFHPLVMGVFLMLATSITAFSCYFIFSYSWYSYIMILVFLGGMLILFIYVASLAPNEFVKFNKFYLTMVLLLLFIPISDWVMSKETNSVVKIYESFPVSIIILFLVSYLLFTFISVVKLVGVEMGPLREYF